MSANDQIQDRAIQHAIARDRYGAGTSARMTNLLNEVEQEIIEKIAGRIAGITQRGYDLGPKATKRLLDMLAEVQAINAAIYNRMYDELSGELKEFAQAEAGFQKAALDSALAVSLETTLPSPTRLRAIVESTPINGKILKPWVEDHAQGKLDLLTAEIRKGMIEGESTDKIVRRIRGTKAAQYTDGVMQAGRNWADGLVRTSVNHVSNYAAQETWRANSNVVKGWVFTATLDARTTTPCASKDGNVYPIGEGPIPPLHPKCRSISVALTKSFRELGIDKDELEPGARASMDGQVAGRIKYPEWLKGKGLAFQEDVLGKQRAQLFNKGKLSLAEMVRPNGSLASLAELKSKYGDILS